MHWRTWENKLQVYYLHLYRHSSLPIHKKWVNNFMTNSYNIYIYIYRLSNKRCVSLHNYLTLNVILKPYLPLCLRSLRFNRVTYTYIPLFILRLEYISLQHNWFNNIRISQSRVSAQYTRFINSRCAY